MRRLKRIIAAATLALTLFAGFAFTASAENGSCANIEKKMATFNDGEITLAFAAKSDAGALKLKIWSSYPIADPPVLYETTEFTEMTSGGTTYKVFSSENVLLQDLRRPYYAALFTVDSLGSETGRGEIVKFSVFDYFLDLLATGTADQLALFTRLLDMGAAMQRQLLGTVLYTNASLNEAGGYANEYYALSQSIYVDGVLQDTEIAYYANPTDVRISADKYIGTASFVGFTDKDGAPLKEYGELTSSTWNELPCSVSEAGILEVTLNYESRGITPTGYEKVSSLTAHGITKDSGTAFTNPGKVGLTTDKKGVASTTVASNSAYVEITSKADNKFLGFYKIIKALSATTYADASASTAGAYKEGELIDSHSVKNCGMYIPATAGAENANTHVFETDLYVYCTKNGTPTYVNLLNADGEAFWGFNINTEGTGSTFSLTVRGGADNGNCFTENITLKQRDWYNLRVEYGFTDGDEVEIKVYVDGMLTATYTAAAAADKDATLSKVQFYHADGTNNATLKLDNTIITSVKAD